MTPFVIDLVLMLWIKCYLGMPVFGELGEIIDF